LLSAAIEVFRSEGLEASVDQIAQHAGVGVGTLYRRFPTKHALVKYIVDELIEDLTAAASDAQATPGGRGLERFLRAAADHFSTRRGCLQQLWAGGTADESAVAALSSHIDQLFTAAREHGAVRREVIREDVSTILWALAGIVDNAPGDRAHRACTRLVTTLFDGMRPAQARVSADALAAHDASAP
jgi:AcrR family transcriptional regulator